MRLYDEFVDFLVESVNPRALAQFQPSPPLRDRVAELVRREQTGDLAPEERTELERFRTVEEIGRLAKSRMRQRLISE